MEYDVLIAPSLLSADFSSIKDGIALIEKAGGDWIHFDVMDGQFVPNITFGPKMIADARPHSKKIFDVHLMINTPEQFVSHFAEAGADYITIHLESTVHVHRTLEYISSLGKKAGITIVPSTPVSLLEEVLPVVELVLIMSVNPGFGGQKFIPGSLGKLAFLKEIREKKGYNFRIEVDGGVNENTYREIIDAGADVLVMGSAFFSSKDPAGDLEEIRRYKK
ncbi:MAG: ribulose-phosphate 3-epimerase [Spirochaetales bacterium]|nr:ribulose-phosphate 3-epimerase [Spirochaetales bacterium]